VVGVGARRWAIRDQQAKVSESFRTLPVERAVEYALGHAPIDYHTRSDFGYAFARFCRESLERLDRKTTLLILGDARDYNDPQAWRSASCARGSRGSSG
jgi:uncharacterized protein with von Willebrand factor type A (vWA) domain